MSDILIYGSIIVMIAIVAWLLITNILKNKKRESKVEMTIEIQRLLEALGGIDNITSMEATPSKVSFIVANTKVLQMEVFKEIGATGVVQSNQKITAIFGKVSPAIVEEIEKQK